MGGCGEGRWAFPSCRPGKIGSLEKLVLFPKDKEVLPSTQNLC